MKRQEQLDAIRRVLELVDGYAGTQPRHILMGWEGGLMTWAEIREHITAALRLPVLRTASREDASP